MQIHNMFAEDINRPINGVIKVDQDTADVIEQEVREYVITKELKKHFISFFDYYSDSFDKPTDDIGVWISGFFGSGKSHFLKMLSYILENKPVGTTTTVEMFRKKFEDDPATFMLIDKATRGKTKTILFNIDIEGSINKDKTAVLRVFNDHTNRTAVIRILDRIGHQICDNLLHPVSVYGDNSGITCDLPGQMLFPKFQFKVFHDCLRQLQKIHIGFVKHPWRWYRLVCTNHLRYIGVLIVVPGNNLYLRSSFPYRTIHSQPVFAVHGPHPKSTVSAWSPALLRIPPSD